MLAGVVLFLKKVGLHDSSHCHCNQVRLENGGSGGEATNTYPVSVNLKDIDTGESWVLEQVVHLGVNVERGPLAIESDCVAVGYTTA